MNIFFDIQDTLLTEQGAPRPHAREVLLKLAETGHGVYLWSTAGEGYAAQAAWVLGVEDAIRGCCLERHPPEGITVDYAVDDDEGVVEEYGGYLARLSLILATVNSIEKRTLDLGGLDDATKDTPTVRVEDVNAAIALIEYFKAHARKVYAKLHEENPKKLLADAIRSFLAEHGGDWEGRTSDLYEVMASWSVPNLPGGAVPFGKQLREISNKDGGLNLKVGHPGHDHIIKLSLSTFGTVGDANSSASTDTTDSKSKKKEATTPDRRSQIIEAVRRLFKDSPENKDKPEPDLIANDLYLHHYLDFYPEDEEVAQALKLRVGA